MERDFLGLSSANFTVSVKEERSDDSKSSALARGSGMQWSFSNKVSAVPQFLSLKVAEDDSPRKNIIDPLTPNGFMNMSAYSFDAIQKPCSGVVQKNVILDRKAGNHHAMTVYTPQQYDAALVRPQEGRIFPVSNSPNSTVPVLQSHLLSPVQNGVSSTIKQQSPGGVPIFAPASVLQSTKSVIGSTDLRNTTKSSAAPVQLTIFYAGSVSVYDDISPEKAQAIMLLANNEASQTQNPNHSTGRLHKRSPLLPLPSPLSGTHLPVSQPAGGSSSANELVTLKPVGNSVSPTNHLEHAKAGGSVRTISPTFVPAAVPQARKASLARFLEKRKERLNTSPYHAIGTMKMISDCNDPGSDSVSFSVNSAGSCDLPAVNHLSTMDVIKGQQKLTDHC